MNIKFLLPSLAALMFAVTASAQSDPSVGGSFRGSTRTAGTVSVIPAESNNAPDRPSFWNRLTGRDSSMTNTSTSNSDRSHGWFGKHRSSDDKPAPARHGWFGTRHDSSRAQTRTTRSNTTTSDRSSGWHLPFFNRR